MALHRRTCAAVISGMMFAAGTAIAQQQQQQPPIKPSAPSVVAAPVWSRVLPMPDGRTFVTDGGLSVDARFAKPAKLPSVVLAPNSGKIIADRMAAPYDKEILLAELRPGSFKNSFTTPDGIALNGNYVTFLRQILPARTRLRTKGATDAVVAVTDGQAVAILMPLAMPK